MKLHLLATALIGALATTFLQADEITASSPVDVPAAISSEKMAEPSTTETPRKSSTARKVATDYAPAQDLLLSAMSLIGVKYKWGGSTPEAGLDCSGFVTYVFKNSLNILLPRTALGMSGMGENIDRSELKPGDLVFFNTLRRKFSHVGIYLGDNRFIHSPRKGRSVEIVDMNQKYWTSRFDGARRLSNLGDDEIDIAALLNGRPARISSAATTSGKTCRKVTTVRQGKKVISTVCSKPVQKKVVQKTSKPPIKTVAKKPVPAKPVSKPGKSPPAKKP